MNGKGRADQTTVDTLEPDGGNVARTEGELGDSGVGEVRPALTPAQLAFLALIAAILLTLIRRIRRRGAQPPGDTGD